MVDLKVNNSMLSDITIIIPTKNRQHYLERIVDYYTNSGIHILIADATEKKYVKKLPDNITYYHYPNIPYCTKLNDVFEKIKTPYSLLCADDDFIVPDGINKCIDFLNKNPSYNSAQGHYTFFYHSRNTLFYLPGYMSAIGADFKEDTARERIQKFNKVGVQFYYCIHKTETLKAVFNYSSNKFTNLNLVELFIGMSTLIKGKHKVLPVFYSVRELLYGSAGKSHGLDVFSVASQYKEQYDYLFSEIVRLLIIHDNIDEQEAVLFFKNSIQQHINNRYSNKFSITKFLTKIAKAVIPFSWRKSFRHYSKTIQKRKTDKYNMAIAIKAGGFPFINDGVAELQRIEQYIKKYNIHQ